MREAVLWMDASTLPQAKLMMIYIERRIRIYNFIIHLVAIKRMVKNPPRGCNKIEIKQQVQLLFYCSKH